MGDGHVALILDVCRRWSEAAARQQSGDPHDMANTTTSPRHQRVPASASGGGMTWIDILRAGDPRLRRATASPTRPEFIRRAWSAGRPRRSTCRSSTPALATRRTTSSPSSSSACRRKGGRHRGRQFRVTPDGGSRQIRPAPEPGARHRVASRAAPSTALTRPRSKGFTGADMGLRKHAPRSRAAGRGRVVSERTTTSETKMGCSVRRRQPESRARATRSQWGHARASLPRSARRRR